MQEYSVKQLFQSWEDIFHRAEQELTTLDGVAGDKDLGIVMKDGFYAVNQMVQKSAETDLGKLFYQAGKAFNEAASSSMGTLLSMGFMTAGKKMRKLEQLDVNALIAFMEGLLAGIEQMGQAKEGEKTFLDGMYPALRAAVENRNANPNVLKEAMLQASKQGVDDAKNRIAVHGRMAYRAEASIGMVDPGSMVAYYIVEGITQLFHN